MPDPGLKIAQELVVDDDARRVIAELSCWNEDSIPYAREVASDLGMPVEQLRRILHRMIEGGYATYGTVFRQDDGMPMGSSYWLTETGVELRHHVTGYAPAVLTK